MRLKTIYARGVTHTHTMLVVYVQALLYSVWYGGSDTLATVGPSVVSGPPKSTAQGEEKHGRESLALAGKKKKKRKYERRSKKALKGSFRIHIAFGI